MIIAEFRFIHCGYWGSLNVSAHDLVSKIQEYVNSGQRLDLFLMLAMHLFGESVRNRVGIGKNSTLMELKEFYKLSCISVTLSNGVTFQIV